eukprot:5747692-Amphidinium_carterae.1
MACGWTQDARVRSDTLNGTAQLIKLKLAVTCLSCYYKAVLALPLEEPCCEVCASRRTRQWYEVGDFRWHSYSSPN